MSVADSHVEAALGRSVSSLMVSLAGLQIFDALILYVTGDNASILCALGRNNYRHGTVVFDKTLLDTQIGPPSRGGQPAEPGRQGRVKADRNRSIFWTARPGHRRGQIARPP
jgi:hypothetical protein